MIPYIDQFMDTREKRYHLLILVILLMSVFILLPYIFLSIELMQVKTYDDAFALLNKQILEHTYLSRVILNVMSLASVTIGKLVVIFLKALRWYEAITIFCMLLMYSVFVRKRASMYCFYLLFSETILIGIFSINALSATSLRIIISYLHCIGYTICIISTLQMGIILYSLFQKAYTYKHALGYEVIEIKEHMDIES